MSALTGAARRAAAGAVLGLAVLLGGCAGVAAVEVTAPTAVVVDRVENPFAAGRMQDPRIAEPADATASAGSPARLRIPAIGVDTALENLGIGEGGLLAAPVDYDLAGWYSGGVVPGAIGPAIIAGHVDSPTAPAVFARLGELAPDDEVIVTMSDGSERTFQVTGSTQSAKSNFPSAAVYSNVPSAELRLITCAGGFDTAVGHYTDNLIVFATLRG